MTRLFLPAVALCIAAAGACYEDDSTAPGRRAVMTVKLTDAPFPFDSIERVDIYVVSIAASTTTDTGAAASSQQWETIATPRRRFNLLELQGGTTTLLGARQIPAGTYRAVRLVIDTDSSSVVHRFGHSVQVSWGVPGELALHALVEEPLAAAPGGASIVIDFDVGRSFLQWSGSGFTFIPFIRAVNEAATGSIAGEVRADVDGDGTSEPVQNVSISVYRGSPAASEGTWSLAATGRTDAQGRYTIAYLPAGTYIVRMDSPGLYLVGQATEGGVSVAAGGRTTLDLTMPPADRSYTYIEGTLVLDVGGTTRLRALVGDSRGQPVADPVVSWQSTNPGVATVEPTGEYAVVTGVAQGSAVIRATSNGRSDTVTVQVGQTGPPGPPVSGHPVATVTVSPESRLAAVGDSTGFMVILRDSLGTTLSNRTVTWSSSDQTVASILAFHNNFVVLRALRTGSVTVRAVSEGRTGTATLTVVP